MSLQHTSLRQNRLFPLLWLSYLIIACLFAVFTPQWQTPDEPAHYNYVKQLAEGTFPVMTPGDYDQAYFSEVISSRFDPQYNLDSFRYENYQPPLFYIIQTPIYWLSGGSLLALRLFSVLLSSVTLIAVYMVAWHTFDGRAHLALTAASFWAFLPQNVAMMSSVNNDVLAALWIAIMLWLLVTYRPTAVIRQTQHAQILLLLGIVLGLAFLTKVTAYLMAPVIFLVLFYHYIWQPERRWQLLVRSNLLVFVPAGLIGSLWWVRNLLVYGWPDFLGIVAHDAVVVGQPTTAVWLADYGPAYLLNAFVQTTFQSFWGQFGWMAVPMPRWVYAVLFLFTFLILLGHVWELARLFARRDSNATTYRQETLAGKMPIFIAMTSLLLLNIMLYLLYNLSYVQHQARYLFASLIPISLGVAVGCNVYLRPLYTKYPPTAVFLPLSLALGLIGLNLYALFWMIVPALSV